MKMGENQKPLGRTAEKAKLVKMGENQKPLGCATRRPVYGEKHFFQKEKAREREMKDFIFIIGTSGIGKTTLGKGLFTHYNRPSSTFSGIPNSGTMLCST